MFKRIDNLITTERFSFQAWDDRYSKGVWAALGSNEEDVDVVRDLSSAGDLDMDTAMDYVFSADWLPYVTGRNLMEAMENLEARLAQLPQDQLKRNSPWSDLVYQAIDDLRTAKNEQDGYGDLHGRLCDLPKTLDEALASSSKV